MLIVTATIVSCLLITAKVRFDTRTTEQYQTVLSSQGSNRLDTDRNTQRQTQ
jgi:hypothetical protein